MDRQNITSTSAGIIAGYGTYMYGGHFLNSKIRKFINRTIKQKHSEEEKAENSKIAKYIWEKEWFKDAGIEIVDVSTPQGKKELSEYYNENLKIYLDRIYKTKNPMKIISRKKYVERLKKSFEKCEKAILKGKNAFYEYQNFSQNSPQKIYINMQNGAYMFLHELGHAQNFKIIRGSKKKNIYEFLRNYKTIKYSLLGLLAVSLLTDKDSKKTQTQIEKEKSSNPLHNVGQFIKNNCGKLAFLVFLPTVLDETSASIHGQRLAQKYNNFKNLKCFTKSHIYSCISYLSRALVAATTIMLSNKARDFTKNILDKHFKKSST